MTATVAAIALLLLSLPHFIAAARSPYDPKLIPTLDEAALSKALNEPQPAAAPLLLAFCSPSKSTCKDLVSPFTFLARNAKNKADVRTGYVDCSVAKDACKKAGVNMDKVIRLYTSASKHVQYKSSSLKSDALVEWMWDTAYPNHVTSLTSAGEKKKPRDKSKARLLLFTEKREISPLYKSIARQLFAHADKISVHQIRKSERKLFDKYGIGKNLPVLMLEPAVEKGQDERPPLRYDAKMDRNLIVNWVRGIIGVQAADAKGSDSGAAATATDAASTSAASIPELADQSCLEKYCGTGLCMIMFLARDNPELQHHLLTLTTMEKVARSKPGLISTKFVWADISQPSIQTFAQHNFDVQVQNYPQLVLLSLRKARMSNYIGSFSSASVVEFLTEVSKGRTKTVGLATKDGKVEPLPAGNQCPPEQETKKTTETKKASSSAPTNNDQGTLHVITPDNSDEIISSAVLPVVLLLHSNNAHATSDPKLANLTNDFERLAKNMRDTIVYGVVDISKYPSLGAEKFGDVATSTALPAIVSLPHGVDSKQDVIGNVQRYDGDMSVIRDVKSWSQRLLDDAPVMLVNATSMQQFMGNLEPDLPFSPKFIAFLKPSGGEDGNTLVIPDMIKSLALEFGSTAKGKGSGGMTFGVASSRDHAFARQFQVAKIPSIYVMAQQPDPPGTEPSNQIRVGATQYGGALTYGALHSFCDQTLRNYEQQKSEWRARAAKRGGSGSPRPGANGGNSKQDVDEHVDLDTPHDDL